MGKKKLLSYDKIEKESTRLITMGKRTKGILKKAIELSKLCDLKVIVYVYDEERKKATHFSSDPDFNPQTFFD